MKVVIAHGGNIGFPGGGTNRVLTFAKALAENGYNVSLVVPKPTGKIPHISNVEIHTIPIKARSLKDQILRALLVSWKAKKLAEKKNAILQIEHSTLGGIAASLGCSNYVLDIHDLEFDGSLYKSIPLAPNLIYYLEKKAVSKASKIIVVSEPMKDFIVNEWKIAEDKIEVISNGYFEEKLKRFDGSEEEEGLISFIGVFTHNVDYDKVIKLAKLIKNAKIYMIGDGPKRAEFIKKIKREGLKNVFVPGFLPDDRAYSILARSQVCINPRRDELHTKVSAGIKIFDYAALGKAIATDRDGIAIVFEKHNAALVSDPANPEEFIENVYKLLNNENLRKKVGRNARKVVKDFTWEKQGKKLIKMYERIEVSK